jgi:arylsulfatase A-like enzyme
MNVKPNLIFIMTDQQRFDALGANGNDVILTPHIDRLAAGAANLQQYYTNCPVCVPSRCTLFTGRYPHSHGIRENYNLLEAGREFHLFRVLKQAGYRLGYCGKNHLLEASEFTNFDYTGYMDGEERGPAEKALKAKYAAWRAEIGVPPGTSEIWRAGYVHDEPAEASSAWQTAEAGLRFLREQDNATPFCLCVSFADPHVPHLAFREYFAKYPLDRIRLYPERDGELAGKARRWAIKHGAFNAGRATAADKKRYIAIYYAMISWVDTQVGRLLDTLRQRGLAGDTIVVFTADHGEFAFEHGLAKKDLVLVDSLLHVPCLIAWPGRIAPRVVRDAMVEEVDLMPTLLDLMGLDTPFGVQGRSCAPLLRGEKTVHKDAVFSEICPPYLYNKYPDFAAFAAAHGGPGRTPFNVPGDFTKAIRERHWRYIWYGTGEEELYDHRTDPHEQHNRATDADCAQEKTRLKMRLLEWLALTEDPLDPNGRRVLQARYDRWKPLSIQPGVLGGPAWVEMRDCPPPRRP